MPPRKKKKSASASSVFDSGHYGWCSRGWTVTQHNYSVRTAKPPPPPRGYEGWVLGPPCDDDSGDDDDDDKVRDIELCGFHDECSFMRPLSAEGAVVRYSDAAWIVSQQAYDDCPSVRAAGGRATVDIDPHCRCGTIGEGCKVSVTVGDVTRTWEMRGRRGGRPRDDEALWVATVEKGAPSPRVLVDARTRSGLAQGGSTLLDGAEQAVRRHARATMPMPAPAAEPAEPAKPKLSLEELARMSGCVVKRKPEAAPAAKRKPEVASTAPDAAAALVAAPPQLTDETPLTAVEQRIFSELGTVSKESATTACAVVKFKSGVDGSAFYVAAASSTSGAAPVPWAGLAVSSTLSW